MRVIIITILIITVAVSFYTLFERKILGLAHNRIGPRVVRLWGLLQPISDGLKLFSKEQLTLIHSNYSIFFLSPIFNLFISYIIWITLPLASGIVNFKYSMLVLIIVIRISVYSFLGIRWSSNSNYSLIGALRCVAQTISYEVRIAFILISVIFLSWRYRFFGFSETVNGGIISIIIVPLLGGWIVSCLAETNRTPYDLSEGESELVSGFNVEYGGGMFALLFIAEYNAIIYFRIVTVIVFCGCSLVGWILYFMVGIVMYLFVWCRVSYPRIRYDKLMSIAWTTILPSILTLLLIIVLII